MKPTKIQIKSIAGLVLFEHTTENNSIAKTLTEAIRCSTNLWGADLREADLRGADLWGADLRGADLQEADLQGADLRGADLWGADLRGADLQEADLQGADLRGADLQGANLQGAHLRGADLKNSTFISNLCPVGEFKAFKKCRSGKLDVIVTLLIPEDAKRSNATSYKCRCDKAMVISIEDMKGNPYDGDVSSNYDKSFKYKVGETVIVDNFDPNRWNECSTGIHFFIDKQMAKDYNL